MERHNNFDLLRLAAAISVIFSHAFLLAEKSQDHDPLMMLTGQTVLGVAGVFMFFTISGYLITQSFETTPSPLVFLAKRALRIFPGLIVCLLVCVFVIGAVVTSLPLADYLARRETWLFLLHNAVLDVQSVNRLPGVAFAPGNIGGIVNGPLWSLPCEALMYLMLFGLGLCRLLTLPIALGLMAAGILCLWFEVTDPLGGAFWLLSFFAAGICLYRLRGSQLMQGRWVLVAAAGLLLSVPAGMFLSGFAVFGSYLTIYLATSPRLPPLRAARFGDLSYGHYIYGWPIEQTVVWLSGGAAPWWVVFFVSLVLTAAMAFLSWHLIERRCRWRGRRRGETALAAAH